jgi:hypothetical protein
MYLTKRPDLINIGSGTEFKQWYWLKEELVVMCKELQVSYSGSKADLTNRIADFIDFGLKRKLDSNKVRGKKKVSKFNWARSSLNLKTVITDSYTNGPNTRAFFKIQCGKEFSFTIPFMDWMRENVGRTLEDAVMEWRKQYQERKDPNFKSVIPPSNQYNKYIRDFFDDNPGKSIREARHYWMLKRSLPGKHIYEKSDFDLKPKWSENR